MENKKSVAMFAMAVAIFLLFGGIVIFNLSNIGGSQSFYAKVEATDVKLTKDENNVVTISSKSDYIKYCVKVTKTDPKKDNACWKNLNNKKISLSKTSGRQYLWLLDSNNKITPVIDIEKQLEGNKEVAKQYYTVNYNYNLFDANQYKKKDIVSGYNQNLQIVSFKNTWKSTSFALGRTGGIKLTAGETYKFTVNYVGGSYKQNYRLGQAAPRIIMEFQNNNKNFSGRKWGTHYIDGVLPLTKDASFEKTITITEDIAENTTNLYFWLWQKKSGNTTFEDNYRVQVFVTKVDTKQVVYKETYAELPEISRDGYIFLGWYPSLNSSDEIVSTTPVSKNYNHTLYAHWQKGNANEAGIIYFDQSNYSCTAGKSFETIITASNTKGTARIASYSTSNPSIATIDDKVTNVPKCVNCKAIRVMCHSEGETSLIARSSTGARTNVNLTVKSDNSSGGSSLISNSFDYNMIHQVNKEDKNYMISPYSIAYALSILKDGASADTKKQIENVLGKYMLDNKYNVENHVSIANALFIRNQYKNDIRKEFINKIKNNYDAEILFDEYKTPDKINNWVKNKTYNMIDKVLDNIDSEFVLGIANAIAIDVEWESQFQEASTKEEEFTKLDNSKINVEMMHSTDDAIYIENNKAKGIIKDYKKYGDTELEFIAVMPNDGNIKEYINKFDKNELDSLIQNQKAANNETEIRLSLPKFKFDYDYKNFKDDLINMGIKDAFVDGLAQFKEILTNNSRLRLYVNEAIHKTHIDLSEYGTKAAAVTYFGVRNSAMPKQKQIIDIKFDRPFLFLIKDKNSDNIWFFGIIYEP